MSEEKQTIKSEEVGSLIKVLEIYSETNMPVNQEFYQGLCLKAKEALERFISVNIDKMDEV